MEQVSPVVDDSPRWTMPVRLPGQWERSVSFAVAAVVRAAVATVSRLAAGGDECRLDHDGQRRWTVTLAATTLTLDVSDDHEDVARSATLALHPRSADVPDDCAILLDLITIGLESIAAPLATAEEVASDQGLSRTVAATIGPVGVVGRSSVTVVRTCLAAADLHECLTLVPFRRMSSPGRSPVAFVLGETGHLATQQVDVTLVREADDETTAVISWRLTPSGNDVLDVLAARRARVCVDALCDSVTEWDPDAERDDDETVDVR